MTSTIEKQEEIKQAAETLYAKRPDWVTFYREMLGLRGMIRRRYPTLSSLADFEQTEVYQTVQLMLTELRKQTVAANPEEPTRVITVRIPKSLHEALRIEAHEHRTSMNKLCISKLLQFIDNEMVPTETQEEMTDVR